MLESRHDRIHQQDFFFAGTKYQTFSTFTQISKVFQSTILIKYKETVLLIKEERGTKNFLKILCTIERRGN